MVIQEDVTQGKFSKGTRALANCPRIALKKPRQQWFIRFPGLGIER